MGFNIGGLIDQIPVVGGTLTDIGNGIGSTGILQSLGNSAGGILLNLGGIANNFLGGLSNSSGTISSLLSGSWITYLIIGVGIFIIYELFFAGGGNSGGGSNFGNLASLALKANPETFIASQVASRFL